MAWSNFVKERLEKLLLLKFLLAAVKECIPGNLGSTVSADNIVNHTFLVMFKTFDVCNHIVYRCICANHNRIV